METQVQTNQPQAQDKPGVWRSIIGVVTSPGATFSRLAQEPVVLKPTLILTALAVLFTAPFYFKYVEYANAVMQKNLAVSQLPPGMEAGQLQAVNVGIAVTLVIGRVIPILLLPLILAGLLKLLNMLMGEEARFDQLWSLAVFSCAPYLAGLLLSNLLLLTASGDNLLRTFTLGTSLATLVPVSAVPAYLLAILTKLNVFFLWSMVLTVIGTAQVFRSKASKVGAVVFGVWFAYVLITAYFARTSLMQLIS